MDKLARQAFTGLGQLLVALAVLLFVPAWSLDYWEGWVFLLVFSSSVLAITLYYLNRAPGLIESRLRAGPAAEKKKSQRMIQAVASIFFILTFIVSGLDHRFGWSDIPISLVIGGNILVVLGLSIVFLVFRENRYSSGIIEVGKDQRVISTGPYAVVRHPMYAGAFIMLLGVPLALGSWWALLTIFLLFAAIVWRLLDEEKFLVKNLLGYAEYCENTRYRLIPFLW
jgi:protein-S-isoprenylcysteine O-methyltransferase Ste14